eukprot:TRINITY_DN1172_c0_g1_i1.p1 TRINITY_DN1172_c0_g1~~TRINITY_DN1172_c0_g1_i1.p1  ORF type:complete len:295 (+),score=99.76 TRINITY_DN1172_c0_g1_i1:52-885(+)
MEDDDNTNPELDDLVTDAQDAYFDGKLELVVQLCEKALKIAPKDNDSFDMLILALTQKNPPDHQKALDYAKTWSQKFHGTKSKPLRAQIRAAYHVGDLNQLIDATNALTEISEGDPIMDLALSAAYVSDLGNARFGEELAASGIFSMEDLESDDFLDSAEIVRARSFIIWATTTGKETIVQLQQLIDSNKTALGIGFLYCLIIVRHLDLGELEEAQKFWNKAVEAGLKDDEYVIAAKILIYVAENNNQVKPEWKDGIVAVKSSCNDLIKKRLENLLK